MYPYKINCFSEYVLRTPLFPISAYLNLIQNYRSEEAILIYNNPLVKEAINLASPELKKQLDRWASDISSISTEKKSALELTFLKYLARMSTRCTPFGLFAGCSVGNFNSQTAVILESPEKHTRFTQLDMQYWISLLQDIAKRKEIALQLRYYPNSSIYKIGDFFRYIEYKYINTRREHSISALRKSFLLEQILLKAKSGITISEMINFLADDESEKEDAENFIFLLISYQFLVSELDGAVTVNNEWKRVLSILKKFSKTNLETEALENLQSCLSDLDKTLVPSSEVYNKIIHIVENLGTDFEEKHLFQTDLNTTTSDNSLDIHIQKKTLQAIYFLNGIQPKTNLENLENFKKAFIRRYEHAEMPLTTVLDTEIGIGYVQDREMNDTHEILDSFSFKGKTSKEKKEIWTEFDFILQKKLHDSYIKNEKIIPLRENDFPYFDNNLKNTPVTFSVIIEVSDDKEIAITSSGNISASKLLGRFCNGNKDIYNLVKEIIRKEDTYYNDKILAEIVHIPESRTGNILKRPSLRKHEISYLSQSGVSLENNLDLDDLYISVKGDRVILRSKKFNKEILPCLSNAHNFSKNALPIYHFLCDMELQNIKPIFRFNWGVLENHYSFFPRVIYKNIILSKAKWKIKNEEIKFLDNFESSKLEEEFTNWRNLKNIPRFVNWTNFDNTLLFDFESPICISLFLKSVKNKETFFLEEFLFAEESIVKNNNRDSFSNQIIISYYREKV
ncbi:lantibiotic dehydratase family protein [Flavobacterium sp.]|uniref:lantibiotic dehydratase family protein n=1 Tax=Flavobacterium sp. TaxID=239 RepID=UPI0031E1AC5C